VKKLVIFALVLVALAVPATASANGYSSVAGISGSSSGPSTPAPAAGEEQAVVVGAGDAGGTLPFTGLDAGLMLGVGVLLVGGGLLLRRFRPHDVTPS